MKSPLNNWIALQCPLGQVSYYKMGSKPDPTAPGTGPSQECFDQLLSMCHGLICLVKHSAVPWPTTHGEIMGGAGWCCCTHAPCLLVNNPIPLNANIACSITHPNFYIVSIYIYSHNNHHLHLHHHHHDLLHISIYLSTYLSIYIPLPWVQVRSDSLAVLMDRIAVQAPHLFTTPGALTFVISQVERLAPRIQGWKIMKTPGFGCFGMKHVPMFFDSDAGLIWVFCV